MRQYNPKTISMRCTVEADFEPVTLEEAKLFCRVDHDAEDALITTLISAARQHAERQTGRVICASTWQWTIEGALLPYHKLVVQNAPCSALTALTVGGAAVDSSLYEFVPSGNGANEAPLLAHLTPLEGFPESTDGERTVLTLSCGWGLADIPTAIKQWILVRVSTLYEQRESFAVGSNFTEFGHSFVDGLLDPYRIPRGL